MSEYSRPLCCVLVPFGVKKDPLTMAEINFDAIYNDAIRPAIEAAEMSPARADEERTGGIIQKRLFERLLLCDFAIADMTMSNANVFYELGVRHATRPHTTITMFAEGQRPPFDVNYLRGIPYQLGEGNHFGPQEAAKLRSALTRRLWDLRSNLNREPAVDSPLFQLLTEYRQPDIAHLKTDVFRERIEYSAAVKQRLAEARTQRDVDLVDAVESQLSPFEGQEFGLLVDLFYTWRALSKWDRMIGLFDRLPWELKRSIALREQLGFALNRAGQRDAALRVLQEVLTQQGPSSETFALIGRVYKDKWKEAKDSGGEFIARGFLERAIDAYVRGFSADSRDALPGINAVTLLDIAGDEKSLEHKNELLPVVLFAVRQRLKSSAPRYWDYATLLELAVLEGNVPEVYRNLAAALASDFESWSTETTANNLRLIQDSRKSRGRDEPWLSEVITALTNASG